MTIKDKIKNFLQNPNHKIEIDDALNKLTEFRLKYPFKTDPNSIDNITTDDLYQKGGDYFFKWVEFTLKQLGALYIWATVYENVCNQIDDFKDLMKTAVSDKSLAEKVDASWEIISGMGEDKHLAKKIIAMYNDDVLPVFRTSHLEHFFEKLIGSQNFPLNYENLSLGQQYEFLNKALIDFKDSHNDLKTFSNALFMRFLYIEYTPPKPPKSNIGAQIKPISTTKFGLLYEPKSHDETLFLFSKLHEHMGFPYIMKIQKEYPDVFAIDENRNQKRIEIETWASQFDHSPEGCDYIVCWENDLETIPDDWPEIIQIKDYL